jgi:hypothetical protein
LRVSNNGGKQLAESPAGHTGCKPMLQFQSIAYRVAGRKFREE